MADFSVVTEITGEPVSAEQIQRMRHRYTWASFYCSQKRALEYACGTGQGLNILLSATPKTLIVEDVMPEFVEKITSTYGSKVSATTNHFSEMGISAGSLDVILIFEAVYYLDDFPQFLSFCFESLSPTGKLLIVTANKDLYDFTPSAFSKHYYSVRELKSLLEKTGFDVDFYGYFKIKRLTIYNLVVRPLKFFATKFNLIPKTMSGKKWIKSMVFGDMRAMPEKLEPLEEVDDIERISAEKTDRRHKVIYCVATKNS
jgi:SAM-dependent methyltransferase